MAALTDLQFLALEAPELSGASLTKNGTEFAIADFFQALLDSNAGSRELAMAQLYRMLSSEDTNASLQLGEFAVSKRQGMSYADLRFYWEQRYRATLYGQADAAPTIMPGGAWGLPLIPDPPAVR
jgi:hypothetical protein